MHFLVLALFLVGCRCTPCTLAPTICYWPPPYCVERLPSPFPPLTIVERSQDWGKELFLGKAFAKENDLYRAITCFKRALMLISKNHERRFEIEYDIFFAYYIAHKYQEAVESFEGSRLIDAPITFPVFRDLLIALYDSYIQVDLPERACRILGLLATLDANAVAQLQLETAVVEMDIPGIVDAANNAGVSDATDEFLATYFSGAKSISTAKMLNAVLPGAGYYYVGQKRSALTSFLINTLFITAAYQLFDKGYVPAGIIVASLETGWYFGGINGAGLEAKQYNENLYSKLGYDMLAKERLFPILMIEKGF